MHIHYVRLVFVAEDAPEFAKSVPAAEWSSDRDRDRIAAMLNESATVVRDAVKGRLQAGRGMDLHYDHPILMLQHMIWHEGYHHGQIKLALKAAGRPFEDEQVGQVTWDVWMEKGKWSWLRPCYAAWAGSRSGPHSANMSLKPCRTAVTVFASSRPSPLSSRSASTVRS